jgi:hypothetical protein
MKTNKILAISMAALMLLSVFVIVSAVNVDAKKTEGNKIGLYSGNPVSLPANEPSFVSQGSAWIWKDLTGQQKSMSMSDELTYFELYINGEKIELKKKISMDDGLKLKIWYVEFEAGHFAPGTYHFKAVWYEWGVQVGIHEDILVTFY